MDDDDDIDDDNDDAIIGGADGEDDDSFNDFGGGGEETTGRGFIRYKVEKVQIKYAKFVKSVNVLALKKKIWASLDQEGKEEKEAKGEKKAAPPTAPKEEGHNDGDGEVEACAPSQSFSGLLNNLKGKLAGPHLAHTTVPFCFICVLHLCNEKNLELEEVVAAAKQGGGDADDNDDADYTKRGSSKAVSENLDGVVSDFKVVRGQ
eukprot:jgi/Bigna1/81095/fgenesh1_pg.77_\